MKHGDMHYFDIGHKQFGCIYHFDFRKRWLWYTLATNYNSLFNIDVDKGFRTKEACEKHIRDRVRITCKQLLKG